MNRIKKLEQEDSKLRNRAQMVRKEAEKIEVRKVQNEEDVLAQVYK
jgi:hypothetical protein